MQQQQPHHQPPVPSSFYSEQQHSNRQQHNQSQKPKCINSSTTKSSTVSHTYLFTIRATFHDEKRTRKPALEEKPTPTNISSNDHLSSSKFHSSTSTIADSNIN